MTDTITLPRSVAEQMLEHLTCPVDEPVREALRAALEQPQVEQEPVAWIRGLPEEATHIAITKGKVRSGGQIDVSIRAFKYDAGVLKVYVTDNDNEYPGWRKAVDAFYHLNFPIVPIYTHPQPPRQPLTPDVSGVDGVNARLHFRRGWKSAERAHGIGGDA